MLSGGKAIPTSSWQFHSSVSVQANADSAGDASVHGKLHTGDAQYHRHHEDSNDPRSIIEVTGISGAEHPWLHAEPEKAKLDMHSPHHVSKRHVNGPTVDVMKVWTAALDTTLCTFITPLFQPKKVETASWLEIQYHPSYLSSTVLDPFYLSLYWTFWYC